MPVTKTAKRALRVSNRKHKINQKIRSNMEATIRIAEKSGKADDVQKAISLVDRAAKKNIVHKNKAARIKSRLSKIPGQSSKRNQSTKKTKSKTKSKK